MRFNQRSFQLIIEGGTTMTQPNKIELPEPDPAYMPAFTDTVIIVKFIGNTAKVKSVQAFPPGHIYDGHFAAAAVRLQLEAEASMSLEEVRKKAMGIQTTNQMPDEGAGGKSILSPG
jgi:hypothetical protein